MYIKFQIFSLSNFLIHIFRKKNNKMSYLGCFRNTFSIKGKGDITRKSLLHLVWFSYP